MKAKTCCCLLIILSCSGVTSVFATEHEWLEPVGSSPELASLDGVSSLRVGLKCNPQDNILWRAEVKASPGWNARLVQDGGSVLDSGSHLGCGVDGVIPEFAVEFSRDSNSSLASGSWVLVSLSLTDSSGVDRQYGEVFVFRYLARMRGESDTDYKRTLWSSRCIQYFDDSSPSYDSGYHAN